MVDSSCLKLAYNVLEEIAEMYIFKTRTKRLESMFIFQYYNLNIKRKYLVSVNELVHVSCVKIALQALIMQNIELGPIKGRRLNLISQAWKSGELECKFYNSRFQQYPRTRV